MPTLKEAIGVASEPFSEGTASQDFMHVDLSTLSDAELKDWRQQADGLDILRPKTEMKLFRYTEREFPVPFRFVDSLSKYVGKDDVPMNRAVRSGAKQINKHVEGRRTHANNSNQQASLVRLR